jgi:ribose transport system substrate-binding protein
VLPELYAGNDSATQAAGLVSSVLSSHPNIVGIFASNVITAEGAANAIQTAGKTGKVAAIGYDASPQEATYLKAGTLTAIISQNPYKIGQLAIENAVKYLDGDKNIPQDQPSTPLVITKDNLNDPATQTALYK